MERYDGSDTAHDTAGDEERIWLSVVEMIGFLSAIEQNMINDPCLMDLAPEILAVRAELIERRELAIRIAAEIEAENCSMPH